ncbi:MAG: PepSY-associated TM helix domain-containing protein [Bacteroidota bacterium]
MSVKKPIDKIHLWLGLASGLVVFTLGITGCIWAFQEEMKNWIYADKKFVQPYEFIDPLSISENLRSVQEAIGVEIPIQQAYLKNEKESTYYFQHFSDDEEAGRIWYWNEINNYKVANINTYTAEVITVEDPTLSF